MTDDGVARRPPTRRDYLTYGGAAIAGGGLLAGCLGGEDPGSTSVDGEAETGRATTNGTTEASEGGGEDASYAVTMAPMGEVAFEAEPETIFTRLTHLAGMAFALGRGDAVNAMHAPDYYDALWNQFTPRLPGVTLDWSGLYSSWSPSRETLYDLDSDAHLADPASVYALDGWTMDDVAEIRENVGPWFGNKFSDRHDPPPAEWASAYEYYGLWEQFERVARVFRAEARYQALAAVRDTLLDTIEAGRPDEGERASAVMAGLSSSGEIWVYRANAPGFLAAHTRPLAPVDALGPDVASGDSVDFEVLLEADPDVLFALGGMHPETSMPDIRERLDSHPVASQIAAVRNDRVYAQGARYQGPILNLFQLEMTAKQLYPDVFGEWPRYVDGPYPEIPADERLFDRERVANAVEGDL